MLYFLGLRTNHTANGYLSKNKKNPLLSFLFLSLISITISELESHHINSLSTDQRKEEGRRRCNNA